MPANGIAKGIRFAPERFFTWDILFFSAYLSKPAQGQCKKFRQPDAFTLPLLADPVEPVVPVTVSNQREPVFSSPESALQGKLAVFVDRCFPLCNAYGNIPLLFAFG